MNAGKAVAARLAATARITTGALLTGGTLAAIAALPVTPASAYETCPPGNSGASLYCVPTPTVPNNNDQIYYGKAQKSFQVKAGGHTTVRVTCPSGDAVVDGSALVQQVDQGTGLLSQIEVLRQAASGTGYSFTIWNPTGGSSQGQAFVSCMSKRSSQGTSLAPKAGPSQAVALNAAMPSTATLSCPTNAIAVDPSWNLPAGTQVTTSEPSSDGSQWTFTLAGGTGTGSLSVHCRPSLVKTKTVIDNQVITGTATGGAGQQGSQNQLICPVGTDGIVGGWSIPNGVMLGDEPQDRSRVFSFAFTGTTSGQMFLDCLGNTTESIGTHSISGHAKKHHRRHHGRKHHH